MITETTTEGMYEKLSGLLSTTVPDFELRIKAELAVEINRLKEEKNAVILGHNYMNLVLPNCSCLQLERDSRIIRDVRQQ